MSYDKSQAKANFNFTKKNAVNLLKYRGVYKLVNNESISDALIRTGGFIASKEAKVFLVLMDYVG